MWDVIWVSVLAGLATPVGALLVLQMGALSRKWLAIFLGLAAGIMVAVVSVDLVPAALTYAGIRILVIGEGTGIAFMAGLRVIVRRVMLPIDMTDPKEDDGKTLPSGKLLKLGWFISLAIAFHDIPEGAAIGAGHAVTQELGLTIALAIALHNIPEGMSMAVPLWMAGMKRTKIMVLALLTGLCTPFGTLASMLLLQLSSFWIGFMLAFAGGAMIYIVIRDLVPEALSAAKTQAIVAMVGGAALIDIMMRLHGSP